MQKEIKHEDSESEEEEENEEFQIKKRKKKFDLTKEEIKAKYNIYLNCKLKYPKSQFCFFYFKGTCLLGDTCQFCHGYEEFSMDRFFKFLNDKEAVEKSSQRFYQKFYFNQIISPDEYKYDNLLKFQEEHLDLFKHKYTFEELQKSRPKRLKIRKLLTKDIIEKFLKELFDKFNYIKAEDLNYYIYNVGYPQSIKHLLKNTKTCFSKNIKEGNKNIPYYIKNISPEEMMNIFVRTVIDYMKNGKFEDYFPINYSIISRIIFTSIKKYEPNLTIYFQQINENKNEFMNNLIDKLINESNKGNFNLIKNKNKNDLLEDKSNLKIFKNIYEDHFKLNNTNFFYLDLNQIDNQNKKLRNKMNFQLFNEGNLFFFNNGNEFTILNYNKFKSFNIDEFYNNKFYFKNCFIQENLLENKIEQLNINSSKEEIDTNIKLNKNNIYNIEGTVINFINDENSLNFFEIKSKFFQNLSIDIEGKFNSDNIRINIIQICDDTNSRNDIYVIDFYTFKNTNSDIFSKLSKILKNIFENKSVKKIFFDGRSDLLSLHKELNICVKNFIDLSSLYSAVNSYKEQYQFKNLKGEKDENTFNKCLSLCKQNYYFKGLNTVLKEFHSNHYFNPLKDKYHKLFKEKEFEYWAQRPIIQEFLLYSSLDVKYEYDTYNNLKNELKKVLINFYEINDIDENNIDLIILLISCMNHNRACENYKNIQNEIENKIKKIN